MKKHTVLFESPGTLFHETTEKPIDSWDTRAAVAMAETIVERHGARPFAFRFRTYLTAPPVPDGEGGVLEVTPKTIAESGRHFIDGELLTVDDVERRGDPRDNILLFNMQFNDYAIICQVKRGYLATQTFAEGDVIVNAKGEITRRGDEPELVEYRAKMLAKNRERRGA